MAQEQSFSLAISLKNLKENKPFIVLLLFIIILTGLYLGYPLSVLKTSSHVLSDYGVLSELYSSPLNITRKHDNLTSTHGIAMGMRSSGPSKGMPVKFGFNSVNPSSCSEDNVFALGNWIYLSVCKYKTNIVIDIRKFKGNEKIGITPTIVGIGLNINQWNMILEYTNIINQKVYDLS